MFKTAFFRSVGVWWRGKAANGEIMQSREPAFESLRASCLAWDFSAWLWIVPHVRVRRVWGFVKKCRIKLIRV